MQVSYKNKHLEHWLIGTSVLAAVLVVGTFLALFGFDDPLLSARILYGAQIGLLCFFVLLFSFSTIDKMSRFRNGLSRKLSTFSFSTSR